MALTVGKSVFLRNYSEKTRALVEIARFLPDRPNPEQVHDLRVTIRRLQVLRRLLPREVRSTQSSREFGFALGSVLKASSQLRDLDTLIVTLEPYREILDDEISVSLSNQRSDAAAQAKTASEQLLESAPPYFDQPKVRRGGLSRRLRKRVKKSSRLVAALVDQVLKDETKVGELHMLRKQAKKLRYLLELAEQTTTELRVLIRWQESLGAIHDLDVAIEYLNKSREPLTKQKALHELLGLRHRKYLKLGVLFRADARELGGKSHFLRASVASIP